MDIIEDLKEFIENETRSCSMDFGGITPLYVYRSDRVTMFATGKVTNERWTCAGDGFVLLTTTNLSATLREPSLPSER